MSQLPDFLGALQDNGNADGNFTYKTHLITRVSTVASEQGASWFNSQLNPFCVEFACSPRARVGSLWVLQRPSTVQKHAC